MSRFRKILAVVFVLLVATPCRSQVATNATFAIDTNFMLVGDSFTNDGDLDWAGKVNAAPEFDMTFFSQSGRRLEQIDALFSDQYTPDTYDAVVIAAGVNDVVANRSFAQIQASIDSIISQTNGEHIVLTTIPPFRGVSTWTAARQATADEIDAWIISLATSNPNISVFDIRSILDLNNDLIIDDEFGNGDGLHPRNCPLGQECGQSHVADQFIAQFSAIGVIVFSNDFEDGDMLAEVGSMTLVAESAIASVVPVTGEPDETLGNNILLIDQNMIDLDLTLNLTETLSLTDGNTVRIDFDYAARRTNGVSRTIFVEPMDSDGNIVTRFILGDNNAFGNGQSDRQRPGYSTLAGGNKTFGNPIRDFWWGADFFFDDFDVGRDAHISLTIGASTFDLSSTSQTGVEFSTTELSNFDGISTDISEIRVASFGAVHGGYFDNIQVAGVVAEVEVLLGDVDRNSVVNFLDIAPFIGVLSVGGDQAEADIDQNGIVNFLDISPFIGLLAGSGS